MTIWSMLVSLAKKQGRICNQKQKISRCLTWFNLQDVNDNLNTNSNKHMSHTNIIGNIRLIENTFQVMTAERIVNTHLILFCAHHFAQLFQLMHILISQTIRINAEDSITICSCHNSCSCYLCTARNTWPKKLCPICYQQQLTLQWSTLVVTVRLILCQPT